MGVSDYHIADWVIDIILGIGWFFFGRMKPRKMFVPENDSNSAYPYQNQGINGGINLAISLGVPLVVYLICYLILKFSSSPYLVPFDFIGLGLGHCGAVLFSGNCIHIMKDFVGRARPDYFAWLKMQETLADGPEKDELILEAFKSFPSGHSCTAMASALFFSLSLSNMIKSGELWIGFLKTLPLIYPLYIGCMRISEYRHHVEDVIAGYVVGIVVVLSIFANGQNMYFMHGLKP